MSNPALGSSDRPKLWALLIGVTGVIYGDIGTSPLYAIRECFAGPHPLAVDEVHVLGILSLVFWAIMGIVSFKYVMVITRADNKGEGGSLALLALAQRVTKLPLANLTWIVLGVFAAALFYGDSMITPAISVLSAVEGLEVATPALISWVEPITVIILIILFAAQRYGTGAMGGLFGPVMIVWFATLATLGVTKIIDHPEVLWAVNPYYAVQFFLTDKWIAFLALGSVFLVVTGSEALYSDMGHFGRRPLKLSWFMLVMPALLLNYFGQGALLLENPAAKENPFYLMAPEWGLMPLVGLATMATIIASQAVISGAYSMTQQAIQLGFLPRLNIVHTSRQQIGQIYIPFVNWTLLAFTLALVLGFHSSSNLASAYGVAVSGTMLITSIMIAVVIGGLWKWRPWQAFLLTFIFLLVDLVFFATNATKITHGGWFPLVIGVVMFVFLTTWKRGRALLNERLAADAMPLETFLTSISDRIKRISGTAVFMTGQANGVPHALLHNMKHNKVLHERNLLLTVKMEDVAHVPPKSRLEISDLGVGFYRVLVHYGFMDDPDVPAALALAAEQGLSYNLMDTSFFLSRETIIPKVGPGMALWREAVFAWMCRNAASAMDFFKLPTNRVVELGTQIEI